MEPLEIAVAVLAVPFLTKAWEKTGEKFGEKLFDQGETLLQCLRGKSPETVTAIEQVKEEPLNFGQAVLEVKAVAEREPEIAEVVQAIEATVKENSQLASTMQKVIEAIKSQESNTQTFINTIEKVVNLAQGENASIKIENQNISI
ncbi:hypothetical protein [Moorena sp. SIO3A2]|uniref:hypothetical protein n=1 Tax=Moorena sp. SIO3A2 TaxID=2607841 RepID=UPI00257CAC24|nr:hypothetical protein [Moorena sp. SIO3A2]